MMSDALPTFPPAATSEKEQAAFTNGRRGSSLVGGEKESFVTRIEKQGHVNIFRPGDVVEDVLLLVDHLAHPAFVAGSGGGLLTSLLRVQVKS